MTSSPVHIMPRPRVAKALADAVASHSLVAVTAPMGYGKTTAARELANAFGKCSFYASVPPGPHNARYLWDAMLRQLADQGLEIAAALRRPGFPSDTPQTRRIIDQCRADTNPSLIIIDDYQYAEDPALDAFLDLVVREQLPNFHIALFSRIKPGIPLEELRLKGLAAVFGQEFLAFTREEAEAYFRMHGRPDAAGEAWSYSEGWAAALWLCLAGARKGGQAAPTRDVEALLAETVFPSYDRREKLLLAQLSVLENFTAEEAAILAADPEAARRLHALHDKNAFLARDPATDRYQLHSIFRTFLAGELAASGRDTPALRRLAGECLLKRGELMPALRLFHRAGRDEDRLRLLDVFRLPGANLLLFFFPDEIGSMVEAIPWRLRLKRPIEYLAFIYYRLVEAGDAIAATLLEEAEERFAKTRVVSAAQKKRLAGEALLIKHILAFNDLWAMRDIHAGAHRLLNGRSAIASRNMIWTFGCPHSAYLYLRRSATYQSAIELIENDLHYFHELTDGCAMGARPLFRAEWLLERGEFADVETLLGHARNRAESKEQTTTLLNAAFTLARLRIATGRPDGAVDVLTEWLPAIQNAGHVDLSNCLDLALGYVNACLGRHKAIPNWLREGEIEPSRNVTQILGFIHVVRGKAALAAGDYKRADTIAAILPVSLGPYDNLFGRIHSKTIEAAAARHLWGIDAAVAPLREALSLAKPDGIVLTLAEYGAELSPILDAMPKPAPGDTYMQRLMALIGRYARAGSKRVRGHLDGNGLTAREREMVRLMAKGDSNGAIAKRLGVTTDTVKKTLTSAYGKLKARNRVEAARKFLESEKA